MAGVVLAHLVGGAGCYEPQLRDCTVSCGSANECATGQVCTDGWCVAPGILTCDDGVAIPVDAAVMVEPADGPEMPIDGRDLCAQGCTNGTCMGGVCVIDCSTPGSCLAEIRCPVNLPCRVVCGDNSCDHKILCQDSASCTVECLGENACKDEIHCIDVPCDVTCSGTGSCGRRIRCADSCACDVTCSGSGSCKEAPECPDAICRVGNACSSLPSTCDTCTP